MKKSFIPYEKLSKKEKRRADSAKRSTWEVLSPATRMIPSNKVYNRKKAQTWKKEIPDSVPLSFAC